MKTGTDKVGSITQNIERKRACFQEKYSKGGITRAAVNENVCEDSHTEHVYIDLHCILALLDSTLFYLTLLHCIMALLGST